MFELSREHEDFRKVVRDFAEKEIGPLDTALQEYGGARADFSSLRMAIEEIDRVDQALRITLEAAVGLGINPILSFGTEAQQQQWLPEPVSGQRLAGFGLSEPGAGSDAGATKTKAALDDGEWVVSGAKQFITDSGSEITSVATVTARTTTRDAKVLEIGEGASDVQRMLIARGLGLPVE
jgi:short/branched chain acyl-CoA dehydrogenase